MDVLKAFNIDENCKGVITLVGAGGKTSTMFRLAEEMRALKKKVLVTTTTSIFYPSKDAVDDIIITKDYQELLKGLKDFRGEIIAAGCLVNGGKMKGIPSKWVDILAGEGYFDFLLVEGDGSKGRPIKAPEYYEPVIPESTDIVIGIIGIDAFGKKISEEWVHRPEKFLKIIGKNMKDIIEGEDIAKLAVAEEGLFKNTPVGAEKILFLNKVMNEYQCQVAEDIGNSIISKGKKITKVVIGAIKESNPIRVILEDK